MPGPSNKLPAATAIHLVNERHWVYRQELTIIAQWEIAVAIA
jgi:hypothetical protein